MKQSGYIVYVLEEQNSRLWYIGFTTNLTRRLREHNSGKNFSTRGKLWKLIYAEYYLNKTDAHGRERFLKSGSGHRFVKRQLKNYLST